MRAIELNPSYSTARMWYSYYLMALKRFDEAIAEAKRAQELDPLSLIINTQMGTPFFFPRAAVVRRPRQSSRLGIAGCLRRRCRRCRARRSASRPLPTLRRTSSSSGHKPSTRSPSSARFTRPRASTRCSVRSRRGEQRGMPWVTCWYAVERSSTAPAGRVARATCGSATGSSSRSASGLSPDGGEPVIDARGRARDAGPDRPAHALRPRDVLGPHARPAAELRHDHDRDGQLRARHRAGARRGARRHRRPALLHRGAPLLAVDQVRAVGLEHVVGVPRGRVADAHDRHAVRVHRAQRVARLPRWAATRGSGRRPTPSAS